MGAGKLLAAYAYEVAPLQKQPFIGGEVPLNAQLETALETTFALSKIDTAPAVTFEVDKTPGSRAHQVRVAVMTVAFGGAEPESAVEGLAARLAAAMDRRSKPSLFMVSVHRVDVVSERRVALWTFPQQEVFSLKTGSTGASLVLSDAFSRESRLRKAALIQGPNTKTGMLTARVLDFQAGASQRAVADLWIVKFLGARLQMGDVEGTQLLAQALRNAHRKTQDDPRARDQISAAIGALRTSTRPRWSIESVAAEYLDGKAAVALTGAVRAEERAAMFGIDVSRFDSLVQFQRFRLSNGVVVSAPFVEIGSGKGVTVSELNGRRHLRAEGMIDEEQVRSRA